MPRDPCARVVAGMLECYTADDQDLLKGSVPQPVDWLRAWRHLKEGVSFHSSARLNSTENFAEKDSTKSVERRVVKALQEIIVEEKREKTTELCACCFFHGRLCG